MPKEKAMFSTVGVMMLITVAGKIMGVLRDRMLGVHFGIDTAESIAFTQASWLPRVFFDIMFASVFSASFIPVFAQFFEAGQKEAAMELAARFVRVIFIATAAITVICIAFAAPIFSIWGDGPVELGVTLLRILFPVMIFSGVAFALTGILQSLGEFYIPSAMSVASNGIILLYYFFFIDRFGVYGLAIAFLIGWFAQIAIQVPFLVKRGFFRVRPSIAPKVLRKDEGFRQIIRLALPVIAASWVVPINFTVNARAAGAAGIVVIDFTRMLVTVIPGVFVLSLANVLLPKLSMQAASGNLSAFAADTRRSLRSLFFLLVPMTLGLMAVARPLVRFIYYGGRFDTDAVNLTANALFFFSLGVTGFGLQVILSRACYALKDGRSPLLTGIAAMLINLLLSFALAPLGIKGPALANAITISVAAAGLFFILSRRLARLWSQDMTIDVLKMLLAAILMFFITRYVLYTLEAFFDADVLFTRILTLAAPAAVGGLLYFGGCFLLHVPEARELAQWIRRKLP